MIYDCVVVRSLNEMPIGLESEFMNSDMTMGDSDEGVEQEERMEGSVVDS